MMTISYMDTLRLSVQRCRKQNKSVEVNCAGRKQSTLTLKLQHCFSPWKCFIRFAHIIPA